MAQYEDWFKALWNACIDMLDDTPDEISLDHDQPINGVLETMHGIAEGEHEMWLQLPSTTGEPNPGPILQKYPDEPPYKGSTEPPAHAG